MTTRSSCSNWRPLMLFAALSAILCGGRCLATPQAVIEQNFSDAQKADLAESRELNRQSFELFDKGEAAQATELVLRVLAIRMNVFGADHPEVAASLNNLATLYDAQGNNNAAKSLYERALAINETALGPEHPDVAICLKNLANFHVSKGDASAAIPLFQRALKIRATALGSDHPDTLKTVVELGALHKRQGNFIEALDYYQQSLAILVKTVGADHPETAMMLNRLATVYDDQGQYTTAEALYRRALAVMEKTRGPDHRETATCLNNLAYVFRQQGKDAAALPLYQRALQINQEALGPDDPGTALSLNNLAALYEAQGNSAAALPMFQHALEIREQSLGPQHPETAQSLNNLAMFYQRQHNYAAAKPLNERALVIREKTLGADHPLTAASLNNLAGIHEELGDSAAALPLYERALAVYEKSLGSDHSFTAHTIHNMALLYEHQSNSAAAESMFSKSVSIFEKAVGPAHPSTTTALINSAKLKAKIGSVADSAELFDRSRRGVRHYVSQVLPVLTEREQTLFLEANYVTDFHAALSLAIRNPDNAELVRLSASWLANGKAVAEEALAERNLIARDEVDPQQGPVVRKMQTVRTQLASLAMTVPEAESSAAIHQRISMLSGELQQLQKQLTLSGLGANNTVAEWIDVEQVRSSLSDNAVLVDIARVKLYDFGANPGERIWSPPHYFAWLTHGSERTDGRNTVIINLGPADEIDGSVEKVRQTINNAIGKTGIVRLDEQESATSSVSQEIQVFANRIWQPLETHLDDASEIILSPDGSLWLAPWSALPIAGDEQRYLIEQYQLRFVISGRALIVRDEQHETGRPVILANPSFDRRLKEEDGVHQTAIPRQQAGDKLSPTRFAASARLPKAKPLPNTLMEALAIRPEVAKYTKKEVLLYEGSSALESVAKSLRSPKVATFATHGFFLQQPTPAINDHNQQTGVERYRDIGGEAADPTENPLLRCGLLLAGCNNREAVDGDNDGILTGMEIVGIDFRGTELVVLSACETGVGEVRNGEGVAGLRQAFQLAGAEAVVSTLWQVPDRDSALLMSKFFEELSTGKTKSEALRNAQLERIEKRRERYGDAHPFFWAAFTLTGN